MDEIPLRLPIRGASEMNYLVWMLAKAVESRRFGGVVVHTKATLQLSYESFIRSIVIRVIVNDRYTRHAELTNVVAPGFIDLGPCLRNPAFLSAMNKIDRLEVANQTLQYSNLFCRLYI
jgi:hypothetical protein